MAKKVYLVSLGCAKNLVDSEVMLGVLEEAGYEVAQEAEDAGLLLVNTCGFITTAAEEAIDEILALVPLKEADPGKKLVVTGCLVQRYGKDLVNELPEVDLFIGTDAFPRLLELLEAVDRGAGERLVLERPSRFLMNASLPRRVSTPAHRAFLKITEGCSNACAYCMIPSIRGPLRSRPVADLLTEVQRLENEGVRELTLVAQDLLAYGKDLGSGVTLRLLLEELLANTTVPWLRLLYLHPVRLSEEFLLFMAANPRILPYLDIPLQHVSDRILKAMNRPYGRKRIERILDWARRILPEAGLRTTLMVGFPGETEADVDEMERFLRRHPFDHVGVFAYANEEGCRAEKFPDQVEEEVKKERLERIMAVQAELSEGLLRRFVGSVQEVLVEGVSRESDLLLEGRSRFQAPDVDGCVYITAGNLRAGEIVPVRITEAHTYDLVGEPLEGS